MMSFKTTHIRNLSHHLAPFVSLGSLFLIFTCLSPLFLVYVRSFFKSHVSSRRCCSPTPGSNPIVFAYAVGEQLFFQLLIQVYITIPLKGQELRIDAHRHHVDRYVGETLVIFRLVPQDYTGNPFSRKRCRWPYDRHLWGILHH
jgi:hypothetical protein